MKSIYVSLTALLFILVGIVISCSIPDNVVKSDNGGAYVDEQGVLRWRNNDKEIMAFGVNYTVPFAHAYRMAERLGISQKEAIQQDVYHFARLDFDLYRVHVWDTEISDSVGNIIDNEHLELFDFMINEMKKRNMKFVITPIAFWGNGWPEPDEETPGFSHKYGKEACLTNPDAIEAQANYLNQFLQHVNPYTNIAYKDDEDIIAFEISNEPHHAGTKEKVTAYINKLVASMRATGTQTPIFYNFSHSIHLVDAYLDSDAQGGTFQWYPTGLVANHQINGNYLQYVDRYEIPFNDHPKFKNKAKIVYEFDAADVGGSYMYPAMARSFRTANLQIATQFAYDAMFLAPYNTNYGTHFMNLAYAPQKAISLKIASAVFHEMPRGKDYGSYPGNTQFGNVSIDQKKDLVVYNSNTRFFYTNYNEVVPRQVDSLKEICGYGSSKLVSYSGTGAYFMDKLEDGVWRLEIMPDAYWVNDPYEPVSAKRQKAAVQYNHQEINVFLPDLGADFSIKGIDKGNSFQGDAVGNTFSIEPGVYLLSKKGIRPTIKYTDNYKNIRINEYVAPKANLHVNKVMNTTATVASAKQADFEIQFEVISTVPVNDVEVNLSGEFGNKVLKSQKLRANSYVLQLPKELTGEGCLNYTIDVCKENEWYSYPSGVQAKRFDWDNYSKDTYSIQFIDGTLPIELWKAKDDWNRTLNQWHPGIRLKPDHNTGKIALCYTFNESTKNPWDKRIYAEGDIKNTFKFYFGDKVKSRLSDMTSKKQLVIEASAIDGQALLEIVLADADGNAYGKRIKLSDKATEYVIPISSLSKTKMQLIPQAFPDFQPAYFVSKSTEVIKLDELESLQVSVIENNNNNLEFNITSIKLK